MTMRPIGDKLRTGAWLVAMIFVLGASTAHAAKIVIVNRDGPNTGLHDPTPVAPVGGNSGTTLGEQRMSALQYAANMLGARIQSRVPIKVYAHFAPPGTDGMSCQSDIVTGVSSATLGATGAAFLISFEPNQARRFGARANVYYPVALANALAGKDLNPGEDIDATFNSGLDSEANCLHGTSWYYGLDNKPPAHAINFISTAVHELLHGLGFTSFVTLGSGGCQLDLLGTCLGQTDSQCGAFFQPRGGSAADRHPDIFSTFIRDLPGGRVGADKTWPNMTRGQRCKSITDTGFLVWNGPNVTTAAPRVFTRGLRQGYLKLYAPDPVEPGSSVSHWSTSLVPDPVMGPFDEGDTPVPQAIGIATCLLQDIGWQLAPGTICPDSGHVGRQVTSQPPAISPSHTVSGSSAQTGGVSDARGSADGGGGCALAPGGPLDPSLLILVALALLGLYRRRC